MKKYKLGEICTIVPGYAFKAADFGKGFNYVIKIKDIMPPYIDILHSEKVETVIDKKYEIKYGDFVMAMTGATIGKIGKLQIDSESKVYINQRVCKFIPEAFCDKEYLYYKLNTQEFQRFIYNNVDSKLAQPNIGHPTIYKYELELPLLSEQRRIGQFLKAIDDKINLNRAINHNLEAMAKQLYDYWFLQFDFPDENGKPYKSSGGKMVWNEKLKREIPEGWELTKVVDIAKVFNGATPSTTREQNYGGDIIWITPKDLSDQKQKFVCRGERNISQIGYDSCSTHLLPVNTILMSSRAPIGLLAIAKTELCTNQGFKNFVLQKENMTNYLYYYLQIHIKQIEQLGTGTTFKEVSREDILKYLILKPNETILYLWEEKIKALNHRQFKLQEEIQQLIKLRDELLPLLMNGQIEIGVERSRQNCD
ncbi:restriction endonuclease subunit S [Hoylesella nanceiensis]|uniref:restriction endonuclease subunit S n=3 Tax=Hoylesella nanceiensis TaxID=425941 RepID=UPI0024A9DC18|nr:restriction endonuclease subunit S [Hoylesella nanceiensis]